MSFGEPPYLNGEWAKDAAAAFYGKIVHPTLDDIVNMILDIYDKLKFEHPDLSWKDMVIWVMDIAGAYTHLSIPPKICLRRS